MSFRQERVEVVAGHAARDIGIAAADLVRISTAEAPQLSVDGRLPVTVSLYRHVVVVGRLAAPESRPVIQQNLETGDVVNNLARALRRRAAGIVADHPPNRAVGMRCRLWSVAQTMNCQLLVEVVQHDPGFDDAGAGVRIDRDNAMAVFGPVNDYSRVGTLPG
jgi:hypothetical protein